MILSAVEFSLYTNFVRGVAQNRPINLKPSPVDFCRNFLTFGHQKRANSLKKHRRYVHFDFGSQLSDLKIKNYLN